MKILTTIADMRAAVKASRRKASPDAELALVPTMGALHAGHLSLISAAREECEIVAASIFVNPLQFGPSEDFELYPREFDDDCRKLATAGVDLVFAPTAAEMYPDGATAFVDVAGLSQRLDGASRPGHFRGVATVVSKLFHIVAPDRAYFGQKDAAQVAILQAMVRDLNLPVAICVCATVRESDGLAMSSRNRHLSAAERKRALILSRALNAARAVIDRGETSSSSLRMAMLSHIATDRDIDLEYATVVDAQTLEPVSQALPGTLVAIAARIGATRLIDNFIVPSDSGDSKALASAEPLEHAHA